MYNVSSYVVHFCYGGRTERYTVLAWLHELVTCTYVANNFSNDGTLESIHSSGLLVGGNVDPLVSQHVHAGSQQSRVPVKIKKLLHE